MAVSNSFSQEILSMETPTKDGPFSIDYKGGKIEGQIKDGKKSGVWSYTKNQYKEVAAFINDDLVFLEAHNQEYGKHIANKYYKTSGNKTGILLGQTKDGYFSFSYTENTNNIQTNFDQIQKKNKFTSDWTTCINIKLPKDSAYCVKQLSDTEFEDRFGTKYNLGFTEFKVSGLEASYKFLISGENKIYCYKFQLPMVVKYSFDNNGEPTQISGYCALRKLSRLDYTSEAKTPSSFATASVKKLSTDNYKYEMQVDGKPVLEGYFNGEGNMQGEWKTYYFPCTLNGQKEYLAPAFKIRTPFNKIHNSSYIDPYWVANPAKITNPTLGFQSVSDDILRKVVLAEILDALILLKNPYEYTKYATLKKEGNGYYLYDVNSYHLFQKVVLTPEEFVKGYQYTPDGKIYDSINYTKDEYGETPTKGFKKFNPFPDHPMRKQVEQKVYTELAKFFQAASAKTKENTVYHCKNCNKIIQNTKTAVVISSIDCGNTRYLNEAIFCSNKCRFEYEKGFCRDK